MPEIFNLIGAHNYLPFLIAMSGIVTGCYIVYNLNKIVRRGDSTMTGLFVMFAVLNLYVGIVYTLVIFGVIRSVPSSELSYFMRIANLLQIIIPFWISWRMGL